MPKVENKKNPAPPTPYKSMTEAQHRVRQNIFGKKVIELLSTTYRSMLLTEPRTAIEFAVNAAEQIFSEMAVNFRNRCQYDTKLEEALISLAYTEAQESEEDDELSTYLFPEKKKRRTSEDDD